MYINIQRTKLLYTYIFCVLCVCINVYISVYIYIYNCTICIVHSINIY